MNLKKTLPFLSATIIFIIVSLLYFSPVLKGHKIKQGDITQFIGLSKETVDYRAEKGEEPYWTGSVFSGMPTYQLLVYYPNNYIKELDYLLRFLPRPADYLFLYFFGFFLLLIALKVNYKLAILGALSFGFSTYLIIIFGAGHNSKAHAIAYMPMVLAGILWVFQKRYLLGFIITALAMALEINTNHPQMTYYLLFTILIMGIVWLIEAFKKKTLPRFFKNIAIISVAFVLAIGVNATRLMATKEYADFSTRGKTELTINADGTPKKVRDGLSKTYITEYSYGIAETFNLLIPRFMGGGTRENLGKNSNFYKTLKSKGVSQASEHSKQVLTYWGNQPIVEAPAYIGAILFFLFFLGVFLVKGKLKNWLIAATIFSILLSWGKNFGIVTEFFIDFVPLYNKFRAVSSIQVIAELCIPLLGILSLKSFFSKEISIEEKQNSLKKAFYVMGGITLFFTLFGTSLFAFEGFRDENYAQIEGLIDALILDRKSMLFQDSLRSFILISLSFVLLWLFIKNKLNQTKAIIVLGVLILFDLVSVDLKYVNKENFKTAKSVDKPFKLNKIDKQILEDKSHYRVANFAASLMQDGRTSYFHQSIGGYHAAKMGRYQELFDYQIAKNNLQVLNMLNAKYFISDNKGQNQVSVNTYANGNAWFVTKVLSVNSADEEMKALGSLDTKNIAVVDISHLKNEINFSQERDSISTITLTKYDVSTLEYQSNSTKEQVAIFSEIYYKDGWNAYIDGKLTSHFRANYVLRGMIVPAGKHKIIFKFEPKVIKSGNKITLVSYVLLFLIPLGWFYYDNKKS